MGGWCLGNHLLSLIASSTAGFSTNVLSLGVGWNKGFCCPQLLHANSLMVGVVSLLWEAHSIVREYISIYAHFYILPPVLRWNSWPCAC